jgi:hypothetical protein
VGIGVGGVSSRDQPETYPDTSRTLSNTIMRFFVNDAYRDTVPEQCDCSSQSRRTTANLISVSFRYTVEAGMPYHKDR